MTAFRPVAALALAAGLVLALPGCSGSNPPPDKKDKEKDKGPGTPKAGDGTGGPGPGTPKAPEKVDFNVGVGKEAMDFLTAAKDGTVRADKLSVPLLKAVGLPVVLPGDKEKGYSADEAVSWVRGVVRDGGVGVPFPSKQVGDVALIRGGLAGGGGYSLRLVKDGGAWKVDYLGLTSAKLDGATAAATPDALLQEFVATAFAEVLADKSAMPPQPRAMAAAALMTPALRARWAEPAGSDKTAGFDYSRGALELKMKEVGSADAVTVAQQGDAPVFKVEFTRAGAKKAYLVKLVKGDAGRWLVDDITPA